MLHAVKDGKAGQSLSGNDTHWRDLFKSSEDSLTSCVFERLFYLPDDLIWHILRSSCKDKMLPIICGSLESYEFWPHWNANGTTKESYVEPDVFLRFENFDIIIEAKMKGNPQSKEQWENEIVSCKNEYGNDGKDLFLIALESNKSQSMEKVAQTNVYKSDWDKLMIEIQSNLKYEANNKAGNCVLRVLKDILVAFELHGFSSGGWFENFEGSCITIGYSEQTLLTHNISWEN